MKEFSLIARRQVQKDLASIDRRYRDKIIQSIEQLAQEPYPQGSRKILSTEMTYRIRVGDYRIIYMIDDKNRQITIQYVRHRKDAYKNL